MTVKWKKPHRGGTLRRCRLALHSSAHSTSPSPPSEGGECWGEESRLAYKQRSSQHGGIPLAVRSSRGEGVDAVVHPAASPVSGPMPLLRSLVFAGVR